MTALRELDATFVRHTGDSNFEELPTRAGANGLLFDCPKCGRHSVLVWDRTIPAGIQPGPGRWDITGDTIETVTCHPSINLEPNGCCWHGWVKNGDAS